MTSPPRPIKIESQRDPLVRLMQSLTTPSGRVQQGQYIVEGAELIRRALIWGAEVTALIFSDAIDIDSEEHVAVRQLALTKRLIVRQVSAGLMGKVLGAKPTPPCVAVVTRAVKSMDEMLGCSLLVVADSMENADNMGMFLRSVEAAGADGVVLTGDSVEPFNRKTVRGSRGAVFRVPLCVAPDAQAAIKSLRDAGVMVVATSAQAHAVDYTAPDYTQRVALVVGNEHVGLSAALVEASSCCVKIPMAGEVSSLNVAVAASVAMYEVVRQRRAAAKG